MLFKVADLVFRVETSHGGAVWSRMANYRPFAVTDGEPLFSISLDGPVAIPAKEPLQVFDYDITGDAASLRIYGERYILSIRSAQSGEVFIMDCPLERPGNGTYAFRCNIAEKSAVFPLKILDHFMVQAFGFASAVCDTLLIHASAIVYDGRAVFFLGESGTGKSTHTRLWLDHIPGSSLLNDDAPVARVTGGRAYAYGTPWSGKTRCYKNERYPLAACVRIRRAPYNKIERLSTLAALGALLPSCLPTMQQSDRMLDPVCATLSGILSATPVHIFDCMPDADAARLSWSAIFP